jgi:hypothetical protein
MFGLFRLIFTFFIYMLAALVQKFKCLISFLFVVLFFFHFYILYNLEEIYNYNTLALPFFSEFRTYPPLVITEGLPMGYSFLKFSVVGAFNKITPFFSVHFLVLNDLFFFCCFLMCLSLCFSYICFISNNLNSVFCIFCYFLFSFLFYQYLFFYFYRWILGSFSLVYSLEPIPEVLIDLPYFAIYKDISARFSVNSVLLYYCILLDLDINILVSPEFLALKTIVLYLDSLASRESDSFYLNLAIIVIKHFFSKYQFMLPGDTSYLFFVEFFLDENGYEFIYFL